MPEPVLAPSICGLSSRSRGRCAKFVGDYQKELKTVCIAIMERAGFGYDLPADEVLASTVPLW